MQPGLRFIWRLALVSLLLLQAFCSLVNVTIDDTLGDGRTGHLPLYLPAGEWSNSSAQCFQGSCWTRPPPLCARNGSWHASTQDPQNPATNGSQLVLQFEGSGIYVYGILDLSQGPYISSTFLRFYLDGELCGWVFESNPAPSATDDNYKCNVLLYSNTSLPHGVHNVTIINGGPSGVDSLLIFDYATYTFDNAVAADSQSIPYPSASTATDTQTISSSMTPDTTSPASSITTSNVARSAGISQGAIGGIVAGVAVALLIAGIFTFLFFRRRKQNTPAEQDGSFLTLGRETPLPLRALNTFGFSSARSVTSSQEDLRQSAELKKKKSANAVAGRDSPQGRIVFGAAPSSSSHPFAQARVLPAR